MVGKLEKAFSTAKVVKISVMMKACDVISPDSAKKVSLPTRNVDADTMAIELLPLLLDAPDRQLGVKRGEELLGVVDERSLLEGLGRLIAPRDDSSIIVVSTTPSAFSASSIAHAVEDVDTHLVDLWSSPGADGSLTVTLRVRSTDPSQAVASLERYGYTVLETSATERQDAEVAMERLLSLQTLLNV